MNTSHIGSPANVLRGSSGVPAPRGELHDEPKERLAGEATSNKSIVIKEWIINQLEDVNLIVSFTFAFFPIVS